MTDIDVLFKNRKVRPGQLLPFGFSRSGDDYTYSASLLDGQFEMMVAVTKKGKISAEVVDRLSQEPYVLHRVSGAKGIFVGTIREEYEGVLAAIADACFEPDVFKSEDAGKIVRHVREKYRDELQFLWKRFPHNAVFRRQDNAKWYAALLTVQKEKLGLSDEGVVEIIDVRMKPEHVSGVVDGKKYFPGYHMNKKHWVTMCLDGSVPVAEIFSRIDESFALAAKR